MIIELCKTFEDISGDAWVQYQTAIENLIKAHTSGWHVFAPSRRIAEQILRYCSLSDLQRSIVQREFVEKSSELVGQAASVAVTVLAAQKNIPPVNSRGNQQITLPLVEFIDLEACLPLELIVEDAVSDGEFILHLGKAVARHDRVRWRVNIRSVHGGGGRLHTVYLSAAKSLRPTFCVVDSDKDYPSAQCGATAAAVKAHIGCERLPTVRLSVLPVREIENFIPLGFLDHLYHDNPSILKTLEGMKRLLDGHTLRGGDVRSNYLGYYDYKKGVRRSVLRSLSHTEPQYARWIWKTIQPREEEFDFDDTDIKKDIIWSGVSNGVLMHTVTALSENKRSDFRVFYHEIQKWPFWEDILVLLRYITALGSCPPRLPFSI